MGLEGIGHLKSLRDVLHLDGCLCGIRVALPFLPSHARGGLWFGASCLGADGQNRGLYTAVLLWAVH